MPTGIKGKNSPATEKAIKMVDKGTAVYTSAIKCGITPSALFRALKRRREQK